MSWTLTGARVVVTGGVLDPGWVVVDGTTIAAVGAGPPPAGSGPVRDLGGAWLLPGFVDIHCHGGAGAAFVEGAGAAAEVAAFHLEHGTTRLLASLVTADLPDLVDQLRALAGVGATIAGIHLEGPFLSERRHGAHPAAYLREPDPQTLARLLDAGGGSVRMLTIAPELPGALATIGRLVRAGVVAAIGHTDATYAEAVAGFAEGARVLTHAGNAMRAFHHREPGPLLAAVDAPAVACEIVNDGVHLHDATARAIARLTGDRLVLVTDANAGAGRGDGDYALGGREIEVRAGIARLRGTNTIVGSTLTMDAAVRRAVSDLGLPIEVAAHAAATAPARAIGLGTVTGRIAPGLAADLVVLDDHLDVRAVLTVGSWRRPS